MPKIEQSFEMHTKSIDRFGKLLSATVPYVVFEAENEDDALQAVLHEIPETLSIGSGYVRLNSISIEERCNANTYKVNASYEKTNSDVADDTEDGVTEISFSTGGGTKHIVRSISHHEEGIPQYTNVCKNRIGWNGKTGKDASYAGVDVPAANTQMSLTVVRKMSALNNKWQRNIAELTGKVNKSKFRGYERGEVLFNGVSFSGAENAEDVKVTYSFSIQLNEKNVLLGQLADGDNVRADKLGWQYAWAVEDWMQTSKDGKAELKTVLFRLDTVIEFGDFSKLGI